MKSKTPKVSREAIEEGIEPPGAYTVVAVETDPTVTLSYSQLAALVGEMPQQVDLKARFARLLHDVRNVVNPPTPLLQLPQVVQDAIARAKEPRRQKKTRQMKARVGYALANIKTAAQFKALNSIVPGEAQILSYVGTHRNPGVQEIAIGTELSVKTVKNCTHTLVQKKLILSVKL